MQLGQQQYSYVYSYSQIALAVAGVITDCTCTCKSTDYCPNCTWKRVINNNIYYYALSLLPPCSFIVGDDLAAVSCQASYYYCSSWGCVGSVKPFHCSLANCHLSQQFSVAKGNWKVWGVNPEFSPLSGWGDWTLGILLVTTQIRRHWSDWTTGSVTMATTPRQDSQTS